MKTDKFGQKIFTEADLCDLYLQDPQRVIKNALVDREIQINSNLDIENLPKLLAYKLANLTVDQFDEQQQSNWKMPEKYKSFDIAAFVLKQCKCEAELQRAGQELLMYQERDLFPLLRYMKYLVDTMRKHNIVWGVGRGSSVSSFVLYLIGIHRINSLHYDLSIDEFLK